MAFVHLTQILGFLGLRLARAAGSQMHHAASAKRKHTKKPILEALEPRLTPNVTIQLDYSYDTNGFFIGHPDRQSLLTTAANVLSSRIGDSLVAIVPNGSIGDTWSAVFTNPSTGNATQINNLTVA